MIKKIIKIIIAKWVFKKPKKSKVLAFDIHTEILCQLFNIKNYTILHTRQENINLYVFFKTLFNEGFINFFENYIVNYIKLVSPELVISRIDNNPFFYRLKKLYDKPYYIAFQNSLRDPEHQRSFANYIKNKKTKLFADHLFLFGENDKKRTLKLINSKVHIFGSVINNSFHYSRVVRQKANSIIFISSRSGNQKNAPLEKKIFNFLIKYSEENKKKLFFLSKFDYRDEKSRREYFDKGDWIFIGKKNNVRTFNDFKTIYKSMCKNLVVFTDSTLGFEALAQGLRCAAFINFLNPENPNKYSSHGLFWNNPKNYKEFEKKLNEITVMPKRKWIKKIKRYSNEILTCDYKNKKTIKILNKLLS